MSGDPEQEYFADGIVEDIITALSRVKWFFVIARIPASPIGANTSISGKSDANSECVMCSKDRSGSQGQPGQESRGSSSKPQPATTSGATSFEGSLDDVFELQDKITETVVAAIEPSLQVAEIRRSDSKPTDNLNAYDLYLRALSQHYFHTREKSRSGARLLTEGDRAGPGLRLCEGIFSLHSLRAEHSQTWATAEDLAEGGPTCPRGLAVQQGRANNDRVRRPCTGLACEGLRCKRMRRWTVRYT